MLRTLISGGINWNWYLQADFNEADKTCHIYFYDRWHKYDDPRHPVWERSTGIAGVGWEIMEEQGSRLVYGLRIGKVEYLVTNPQNVFSYRDMTHCQLEAR